MLLASLDEHIKTATDASLVRLFPRFKEDQLRRHGRPSSSTPERAPTIHSSRPAIRTPPIKHAVCQQVLSTIGAGKSGSDVRKTLGGTPFGWPRDAVDAALIALHRLQHVTATLNAQTIALGQLDQNKIAKAAFRVEHATLSVGDRLTLRKLFQALGISCKSGEEALRAGEFLSGLITLARSAGGEAPLPASPTTTEIEDTQRLVGNEQLVAIKAKAPGWEDRIKAWTTTRDLIAQRARTWSLIGASPRMRRRSPRPSRISTRSRRSVRSGFCSKRRTRRTRFGKGYKRRSNNPSLKRPDIPVAPE